MPASTIHLDKKKEGLLALTVAALGVVYGDIATSPLYAIYDIFFGHGEVSRTPGHVIGAISLAVWALILIISCKYILFVLRADNDGQGGVYALYGILHRFRKRRGGIILGLLMLSAGMLFGDGIITPAISVLSAVEGLKVATPLFEPYIVPISLSILLFIFSVQRFGTGKVGKVFGPIVVLWLISLCLLGMKEIVDHPEILAAFDPRMGISFLLESGSYRTLFILGGVMLVITGGEALYADLGHFGAKPIRLGWFFLVFPCLLINYLGQGAFLLSDQEVRGGSLFFSMVPHGLVIPMVILATLATVIASQALISGAFSLTLQAVGLGLFPRVRLKHTHEEHHGQIYIPFTNWALCLGCVLLVLTFQSSGALASAYGLAVSGVEVTTSLAMIGVSRYVWNWPRHRCIAIFGSFLLIETGFLAANSLKFFEGGFIPFCLGLLVYLVMRSWTFGRSASFFAFKAIKTVTMKEVVEMKGKSSAFLDRTVILLCSTPVLTENENVPMLLQHYWDRYGIFPKDLILLDVHHRPVPYVHGDRYHIRTFFKDKEKGSIASVTVYFGFMEDPNVEGILSELAAHHEVALRQDPNDWHIHASQERIIPAAGLKKLRQLKLALYTYLRRNSSPAYYYYGLGTNVKLSIEVFPVRVS